MVGSEVFSQLRRRDADVVAVGHAELDIADGDSVHYLVGNVRPDVIVNCAAWTKVDDCETGEDLAEKVNGTGVAHLADASNGCGALLTHVSTDFVFDGGKNGEWEVDDEPRPLSAYGRTKRSGEIAAARADRHVIVRTSWVFGPNGSNFVEAILRQVESGNRELRVVDDQRGRPTYTPHLASALIDLSEIARENREMRGIYHYADAPSCTWFELASEIIRVHGDMNRLEDRAAVLPVKAVEMPRPAVRPPNSTLSTRRYESVTGNAPGSWKDGLAEYLRTRDLDYDAMA